MRRNEGGGFRHLTAGRRGKKMGRGETNTKPRSYELVENIYLSLLNAWEKEGRGRKIGGDEGWGVEEILWV